MQPTTALRDMSQLLDPSGLAGQADPALLRQSSGQALYTGLLIMDILAGADPAMQARLGVCYEEGLGLAADSARALALYRQALDAGCQPAHCDLARYHYRRGEMLLAQEHLRFCLNNMDLLPEAQRGECCLLQAQVYMEQPERWHKEIVSLLQKAAEVYGQLEAYRMLALFYTMPETEWYNLEEALSCVQKGIEGGSDPCRIQLASWYLSGGEHIPVTKDCSKAVALLQQMSDGSVEKHQLLGWIYCDADSGFYAPEQAKNHLELAVRCAPTAENKAALGYAYYLLRMYEQAADLLCQAEQEGCDTYTAVLAFLHSSGSLARSDDSQALAYYRKAYKTQNTGSKPYQMDFVRLLVKYKFYTELGGVSMDFYNKTKDGDFIFDLARLVLTKKLPQNVMPIDAIDVLQIYTKKEGYTAAANYALGEYYGASDRFYQAVKCYKTAFFAGDANAAMQLARLYEQGTRTVPPDPTSACVWYREAGKAGLAEGQQQADCFKKTLFGNYKRIQRL